MRLPRRRHDPLELLDVDLVRNADREYLDAGQSRPVRLRKRPLFVNVGRSVGHEDEQLGDAGPRTALRDEHLLPGRLQRIGEVRVSAVDVERFDGGHDAVGVLVTVEVEVDRVARAEAQYADLRQTRRHNETAHEVDGEPDDVDGPVVVERRVDDDARRLVERQNDVGHPGAYHRVVLRRRSR